MKNFFILITVIVLSGVSFSDEVNVDKALQDSVNKDFDQDGKYSTYERALRNAQESVYVTIPEKRGYWYTMLDRMKAEEEELIPEVKAKIRKRWLWEVIWKKLW